MVAARSGSAGAGDALAAAAPDIEGMVQSPAPKGRLLDRYVVDGGGWAELVWHDAKAPSLVATDSEVSYSRCISSSAPERGPRQVTTTWRNNLSPPDEGWPTLIEASRCVGDVDTP